MDDHGIDTNALMNLVTENVEPDQPTATRTPSKNPVKPVDLTKFEKEADKLKQIPPPNDPSAEISMEEEVRQAEMESRLRRMITEVLKPSIVKVTRLQTDHELMTQKFQEMIDGHQKVLNAQKEAKEHSEVIGVFRAKLGEFWTFSNSLEDKITSNQKSCDKRLEELDHRGELNTSAHQRLGRNLDRAMQDMDRVNARIKAMEVSMEKGIQKNKERMDTEIRQIQLFVGEIRDMHNKLEIEVWGPEDCSDISPPCLRKLDMQMKRQTSLLGEALEDINALQKLDGELIEVTKRQGVVEVEVKALQTTTTDIGERVEVCAQEAKADFKQASNLMAAFSANLVREARTSFKDELKHAQQMQKEVDEFVRETRTTILDSDEFVKSLSKQLEAMVREVRFDLDSYDNNRIRDKTSLEQRMRDLQGKLVNSTDSSEFLLRGLEHVSGVISMSLQSERMSVALDLQDFVERKDTPYVGVNENRVDRNARLRQIRAERGKTQSGVDPDSLQKLTYEPQAIDYQGTAFERHQLLALREKLVHVAQEVLQQGPEAKRQLGASPDNLLASFNLNPPSAGQTRSSTPARPASRNQPGARGSPLLEGEPRELWMSANSDLSKQLHSEVTVDDISRRFSDPRAAARQHPDGEGAGHQLPVLAPLPSKRGGNGNHMGDGHRKKSTDSSFTPIMTDTIESLPPHPHTAR